MLREVASDGLGGEAQGAVLTLRPMLPADQDRTETLWGPAMAERRLVGGEGHERGVALHVVTLGVELGGAFEDCFLAPA